MMMNIDHVELTEDQREYYLRCARIRQTSVISLLRRIIKVVANDQLVLAILDDDSQSEAIRKFHYRNFLF